MAARPRPASLCLARAVLPNNDGSFDIFDLTYDLQNSANVTVEVFSNTARVRLLEDQRNQTPGKHFLTWDGRDQNGALLPDGAYRVQITAKSVLRSESRTLNAQIDTAPPSVQILNSGEQMRVNSAELLLEGVSEPGAVLWWNGSMHSVIASDGKFCASAALAGRSEPGHPAGD